MRTLIRLLPFVLFMAGSVVFPGCQPTSSGTIVDTEKARERGAEIGEKAAVAAAKVKDSIAEGSVTAKIKAKMALDDTIKARSIDVTTNGTTVTLSGTVQSRAEHDRAVALARETEGVTRVVDELRVVR
jgi:hyperosmotically inducible protein